MTDKFARQAKLPRGAFQKTFGESIAPFVKASTADTGRMNWHALRFNCCPKCGKDFIEGMTAETMSRESDQMLTHSCGFRIRESKYRKIVANQVDSRIKEPEENEKENL